MHLFIGNIYLWGNIANYVISYFHYSHEGLLKGDPNATLEMALMIIPLSFSTQACFNPIGAFLLKKIHIKVILLIGISIMISSVYIASIMVEWSLFVLFYACLFPIGIGLVYWAPIICAWEWFPERKGLISGIIICGFGFGAFIFGFVSTHIVNPDPEHIKPGPAEDDSGTKDILFPKEVALKVPEMLQTCLLYWSILAIIAFMTISRNPEFLR